jgi:hypothetical protein
MLPEITRNRNLYRLLAGRLAGLVTTDRMCVQGHEY